MNKSLLSAVFNLAVTQVRLQYTSRHKRVIGSQASDSFFHPIIVIQSGDQRNSNSP